MNIFIKYNESGQPVGTAKLCDFRQIQFPQTQSQSSHPACHFHRPLLLRANRCNFLSRISRQITNNLIFTQPTQPAPYRCWVITPTPCVYIHKLHQQITSEKLYLNVITIQLWGIILST